MVTPINKAYYYLHTNGQLIKKNAVVVETNTNPREYFNSPFVVKYWKVETENEYKDMLKEVEGLKKEERMITLPITFNFNKEQIGKLTIDREYLPADGNFSLEVGGEKLKEENNTVTKFKLLEISLIPKRGGDTE